VAKSKSVKMGTIIQALEDMLGKKSEKIMELNKEALKRGEKIVTG
jgi:hypothetical protein